ncbi:hypothetical protein [Streptococcus raffinosi]|uniref:Uncharacterized protein n=1 Tax=Streptococcus raffinosi TaxID=3053355 RepID=A0ABT7LSX3_9STRE|nr:MULTISPECIES: hypothetical protein [unclassified Streptococcus]MDL5042628.1 hypothetical protein [Streptococcus sp. VTCC 12812]MDM0095573.1 hypothetical protein [Streptococcus sp. VTCC 12813]
MMEDEFYKIDFVFDDGFYRLVITDKETGEKISPYSSSLDSLKEFVEGYLDDIIRKIEDVEHNYGLAFYVCGFNGDAQSDFIKSCAEAEVFVF